LAQFGVQSCRQAIAQGAIVADGNKNLTAQTEFEGEFEALIDLTIPAQALLGNDLARRYTSRGIIGELHGQIPRPQRTGG
jgi:hypothetical protein